LHTKNPTLGIFLKALEWIFWVNFIATYYFWGEFGVGILWPFSIFGGH
jgi:hypothetical protein